MQPGDNRTMLQTRRAGGIRPLWNTNRGLTLPARLGICALLLLVGCSRKPPYEGKSAAELERMLNDPKVEVQQQGAYGLSRLGSEGQEAVPALIEALKKETIIRQNAALALGKIGPKAAEAVPA